MSVLRDKVLWCEHCEEWPNEVFIVQSGSGWFHQKCGQWLEERQENVDGCIGASPSTKTVIDPTTQESIEVRKDDPVNHPRHYTFGRFEVIDVIQDWKLDFLLANTVKYIARSEHKGKELEDLRKAQWYIARKIAQLEGK